MSLLDDWIAQAKERRASEIHIVANLPVRCRVDGQLENLTAYPLSFEDCENLGRELAGKRYAEMEDIGELDLARSFPCGFGPGSTCSVSRAASPPPSAYWRNGSRNWRS